MTKKRVATVLYRIWWYPWTRIAVTVLVVLALMSLLGYIPPIDR